jgi:hypothetical protein
VRQIPEYQLWLGHAGDLRDAAAILAEGIEVVMEVADSEPLADLPRVLVRLRFPLSDGGSNPAWLLHLAADSLASLIRNNIPTLVCCSMGLSRSVCAAAAGLSIATAREPAEALAWVTNSGPADVSPLLWEQFQNHLKLYA